MTTDFGLLQTYREKAVCVCTGALIPHAQWEPLTFAEGSRNYFYLLTVSKGKLVYI